MQTKQPIWKLLANLGDAHPIDYGGLFVFEDTTGVYPPEIERIEPPLGEYGQWTTHRAVCGPCTYRDGILSDNKFHPNLRAWFAEDLDSLCSSMGCERDEFIRMIVCGGTCERARAWQMIGDYFGWDNLDGYPSQLTRDKAEKRIEAIRRTEAVSFGD